MDEWYNVLWLWSLNVSRGFVSLSLLLMYKNRWQTGLTPPFLDSVNSVTPTCLHVFGRAPSDLRLCFVQLKTLAPSARYSTCKYHVTLKPGLGVTQGHRKYHPSIPRYKKLSWCVQRSVKVTKFYSTIPYVRHSFLLVWISNFVFKTRYSTSKMSWPWNPGQRSLKVMESGTFYGKGIWFPIGVV